MNKGCKVFLLYWGDTLVGFNSFLNMPSGTTKYSFRTHRLVILPDFQGLGLGTRFEEFMGEWFLKRNSKMFLRTTHIRLGKHCSESELWKPTSQNQTLRSNINDNASESQSKKYKRLDDKRRAYSFEYVGRDYNTKTHQLIICDGDVSKSEANNWLDLILDKEKYPIIITSVAEQAVQNVWEEIAKERTIRTEVLYIKNKGNFNINKNFASRKFDALLATQEAQENIREYKSNIQSIITFDFKSGKLFKRVKTNKKSIL